MWGGLTTRVLQVEGVFTPSPGFLTTAPKLLGIFWNDSVTFPRYILATEPQKEIFPYLLLSPKFWCETKGTPDGEKLVSSVTRVRRAALTLTLIHPVSNWTHWATLRRHACLSSAATSASSQVNPIFRRSLLITPLQFALGRPCILSVSSTGPLLYPGTCQYSACLVCAGGPYGRHVQASEVVFLSVCCPWFAVQYWFWQDYCFV